MKELDLAAYSYGRLRLSQREMIETAKALGFQGIELLSPPPAGDGQTTEGPPAGPSPEMAEAMAKIKTVSGAMQDCILDYETLMRAAEENGCRAFILERDEHYLQSPLDCIREDVAALPAPERVQELTVDTAGKKEPLAAHWKRLLNVGYARSLTDGRIQGELRRLQDTVGFEFLRIKGLLDDDMCLLRLDMNGSPVMNYTYVDEVLDFILSLGAKPMLELSFMPSLLAKTTVIRSMRGGILMGPTDLARGQEFIGLLMEHLAERYGREQVARWLFSPWLAPDFIDVGLCSREDYAEVYAASCHALRAAVPRALIVGPGSVNFSACWPWYLEMCRSRDCMPDVLSFRSYAAVGERAEDGMQLIGNNESFSYAVSGDENFLAHTAAEIRSPSPGAAPTTPGCGWARPAL